MCAIELFNPTVPTDNKIDDLMLSERDNDKIISSLDGWSTTLEEDEYALQNDDTLSTVPI